LSRAGEVLTEIEKKARIEYLPIIGPQKGKVLAKVIHETKPKRVLEVGSLIGYSAVTMAKELGSEAELIMIEADADEARVAEKNIKRARVKPMIRIIVGDAVEVIPKLKGMFDLVFLDAEKSEYLVYLHLVEAKLHNGSTIVADNAGMLAYQMRDYLGYVRTSGKYHSRYIPVAEDGLEISVRQEI